MDIIFVHTAKATCSCKPYRQRVGDQWSSCTQCPQPKFYQRCLIYFESIQKFDYSYCHKDNYDKKNIPQYHNINSKVLLLM